MRADLAVPILLYHKIGDPPPGARVPGQYVSPHLFSKHLAYLARKGYQAVSLLDLAARERVLPPRPFVVTFDDGYWCLHEKALPVLAEHGFTATVFLAVAQIGSVNAWETEIGDVEEPMLGLAQIREMQAAGIEFGSHTLTHPHLTQLPPERAATEIVQSRLRLEEMLGVPCASFAYPYGEWNGHLRDLVADSGYLAACTTRRGAARADDDPLALPRINIRRYNVLPRFRYKLWRATE